MKCASESRTALEDHNTIYPLLCPPELAEQVPYSTRWLRKFGRIPPVRLLVRIFMQQEGRPRTSTPQLLHIHNHNNFSSAGHQALFLLCGESSGVLLA